MRFSRTNRKVEEQDRSLQTQETAICLPVGHGVIAAPLHRTAGVGSLTPVPKRIGLKSYIRRSGVRVKVPSITSPDVSTHLRPDRKIRGAAPSLRHRLTRSPDPTGAPSQSEVRRTFRKPHQDGLLGSARNWIAVNAVQQFSLNKKYDNSTLKKINRPVAFAARFPSHSTRVRVLCTLADRSSG